MQVYIANGVYSCAGICDSVLQYSFVLFQGYSSYEVRYLWYLCWFMSSSKLYWM